VVLAMGYANQRWLQQRVARNRSSYAFITDPIDADVLGRLRNTMVWESARPYLYLRATGDRRLLVGGLDDAIDIPARRDRRVERKADKLMKQLLHWFPRLDPVPPFPGPAPSPKPPTACRSSARTRSGAAGAFRHGLRRQRHHLFDDRRPAAAGPDRAAQHALEGLFGFGGCSLQPGMAWLYRKRAPTGIIQATPASVGLYRRVLRGHLSAGAPS
jgi:hypothetical protein